MAHDIYRVDVTHIEPLSSGEDAGVGVFCLTPVLVHHCLSEAEAWWLLRDLTKKTSQFQSEILWKAPELHEEVLKEFLESDRYLAGRRYFVGAPPLDRLAKALAGHQNHRL
jgi:hypothetical protein